MSRFQDHQDREAADAENRQWQDRLERFAPARRFVKVNEKLSGVRMYGDKTTMDVPHKRFEAGCLVYFVAIFPEGDMSIHEWNPLDQLGYGGSRVTFLLEDGTLETVRGPFCCNDAFDHGRARMMRERFGVEAKPTAVRLRVGMALGHWTVGKREVFYAEPALSCDPLGPRLETVFSLVLPCDDRIEVEFEYRGSSSFRRLHELKNERR